MAKLDLKCWPPYIDIA